MFASFLDRLRILIQAFRAYLNLMQYLPYLEGIPSVWRESKGCLYYFLKLLTCKSPLKMISAIIYFLYLRSSFWCWKIIWHFTHKVLESVTSNQAFPYMVKSISQYHSKTIATMKVRVRRCPYSFILNIRIIFLKT